MEFVLLLAVFILGFATMFFAAISGGVGLITRPVLIVLGFPAATVIASSRVAGVFGDWPGLYILHKNKYIDWKIVGFITVPMVIGSILASIATITLFKTQLNKILGMLLLIAGLLFLFKNNIGIKEKKNRFSKIKTNILSFLGTIPISFFGTISGGFGPIYSFFYIWLYGKSFISSSATWKVASNISSTISAIVFIIAGAVNWTLCVPLALGLMIGSYFGTKHGLKQGETWVRYVVLIVTFAGAIKLLFF